MTQWAESMGALRERHAMSIRGFAGALGLSWEAVRRWLPPFGQEPVLSLAVAVAESVGWTVDALIEGHELIGPVRPPTPVRWFRLGTRFDATVRAVAEHRGLSMRALAEQTLVPAATLRTWARLQSEPTIYFAHLFATQLGETLTDMAAGPEHCSSLQAEAKR